MDYPYYDDTESDYIDIAGEDEDDEHHEHSYYIKEQLAGSLTLVERLWESLENCIMPSLMQVVSYMVPLLLCCLLFRLFSIFYMRRYGSTLLPMHLCSALCGLAMLYLTLGQRLTLLLALSTLSFALLQLVRLGNGQYAANAIATLTIGSQFIYELAIWRQPQAWQQLRGVQMITNMKVISLAYDLANSGNACSHMPSPLSYFGYIYSPATCVLGPWLSYRRYLKSFSHTHVNWLQVALHVLFNAAYCLISLTISNCIAPPLAEYAGSSAVGNVIITQGLQMYAGALSVRASHYFVTYLSQTLLAATGQELDDGSNTSMWLGQLVSRPWRIEWPHSLSDLVRHWNMPMHDWLKRYVYESSKQRMRQNTIAAVFCTYLVSALLHGMDIRIYLVLLSLATFANGEVMLRRHLAYLTDACITANPCLGPKDCIYTRCPRRRGWRCYSSWLVKLINTSFSLLAIFHLAYLGVVLLNDTLTTTDDDGENEVPFLWHWSSAGYLSHYIGLGTFVLYLFIS